MAVINAGWLTDFKDIKFAPKTLFSQVYVDNPETGSITDLNNYFTTFLQKLDDRDLRVNLESNDFVKFSSPGAIGVTGTLNTRNGGTGLDTVTKHALLIGNGTDALTLLPSAAGFLVSREDGTAPLYSGIEGSWANLNSQTEGPTFYISFTGDETSIRYNMGKIPLANGSTAGVVSTNSQTFAGGKTFADTAAFNKDVGIAGTLDVATGATIAQGLTIANGYVSGILTPTANDHAANKVYVDAVQNNLNNLSNNIVGGTNTSGETHHTRLSKLETCMTDVKSEFNTLTTYLGGYTDESTKAFFILDKDNNAIAHFNEKGLTVTEVILDGSKNKYKNISLSSYFEKVDQLEIDRGTIYNILGESIAISSGNDHKSRLDGHDTTFTTMNDLNLLVVLSDSNSEQSVKLKDVNDNIGVIGVLPVKHGGTGTTSFDSGKLVCYDGTKLTHPNTSNYKFAEGSSVATNEQVMVYIQKEDKTFDIGCATNFNTNETLVYRGSDGAIEVSTLYASNIESSYAKIKHGIELTTSQYHDNGGYIDFHYKGSGDDYTSRIIESSSGTITVEGNLTINDSVYGAVWNDYAEYRMQTETVKPGYCVVSNNSGQVSKTTKRYQACDGIVSDTFGFAIGETDKCKTPLAVAGRVLAYCEGDRYSYQAGDTVCAGPDGKVCKMTREEIQLWPDRIVGIVSEIPEYDTWGTGNVKVNGRIWIKIK